MTIYDDFQIKNNSIRYIGKGENYTVLELHRHLQELCDQFYGNEDLLDITSTNPSRRVTDQIIELTNGFTIDDKSVDHLYDGSLLQDRNGEREIYFGVSIIGTVDHPKTNIGVILNGDLVKIFHPGYNGDLVNGVIAKCLVKMHERGDEVIVRARYPGYIQSEYTIIADNVGPYAAAICTYRDLHYDEIMENGVYIDEENGLSGTNYPIGSPLIPVNNYKDAQKIAERYDIPAPTEDFFSEEEFMII